MSEERDREYFWTEGCAAFALHLAKSLRARGEKACIAVLSDRAGEPWSEDCDFEFTHAVVSVPGGYIDVNGFEQTAGAILEKVFDPHMQFTIEGDWEIDDFERCFVGFEDDKPFYPGDAEIAALVDRLIAAEPERFRDCRAAPTSQPGQR